MLQIFSKKSKYTTEEKELLQEIRMLDKLGGTRGSKNPKIVEKHCKFLFDEVVSKGGGRNELIYIVLKYELLSMNLYGDWLMQAIDSHDMQSLNDVIFQEERYSLLPGGPSGFDHCWFAWPIMDAIACGDYETFERRLPHELGLSKNGYPFYIHVTNMLMALWYQDEAMLHDALPRADKFTTTKHSIWERAIVSFLCALSRHDILAMETALQTLCDHYNRRKSSRETHKDKETLCVNAYGLLMLAYRIAPELKIKYPDSKNFIKEFADWRIHNKEPELKLYHTYPPEGDIFNKLLMAPVAIGRVSQPYLNDKDYEKRIQNVWLVDNERMRDEFIRSLQS
ncbi:MAG: hypothetical protein PHX08_21025 [Lachnospiraceae bacterium]|nr:hypothetical protein [Lachnospiraceae bacterium]